MKLKGGDKVLGKEPGEIQLAFYKVYYECATNFGFEPINIKYFGKPRAARRYAKKLVKSLLEPSAKESDDFESVIIDDENGEVLEMWRAEYGKVVLLSKLIHQPLGIILPSGASSPVSRRSP